MSKLLRMPYASNPDAHVVQDNVGLYLEQLDPNPTLVGTHLIDVDCYRNRDLKIEHKLNRTPQGYIITRCTAPNCNWHNVSIDSQHITLRNFTLSDTMLLSDWSCSNCSFETEKCRAPDGTTTAFILDDGTASNTHQIAPASSSCLDILDDYTAEWSIC